MKNLADAEEMRPVLEQMRKKYDAQVKQWVDQSVNYNGYQEYGTLFDRNIPWDTKAEVLATQSSKKASKPKKKKAKKPKPKVST